MKPYGPYEEVFTRRGLLQYRFPAYSATADRLHRFHYLRDVKAIVLRF